MLQGKSIEISWDSPSAVHTDGEVLGTKVIGVRIRLVPRAVRVLIPAPV
jgi:diacylglycerol kinase family enzyme